MAFAVLVGGCASSRLDGAPDPLGGSAASGREATVHAGTSVPVADPRCDAARRALLRPGVWHDTEVGPVPQEQIDLLVEALPLAKAADRADLDWLLSFNREFVANPAPLPQAQEDELETRLDRLAVWAAQTCPSPERVWSCSNRAVFPPVRDNVGFVEDLEPISAKDALEWWYGDDVGDPAELLRTSNEVVYAWLDERGMVNRRAEVSRTGAFWAVVSVTGCASKEADPVWPDAFSKSVDVEGPDLDDYLKLLPMVPRPPAGTPPPACRYDPYNSTDTITSFSQYMASGQAEAGCLNWLSPAGWVCLREPTTVDRLACFDLTPLLPPPTTTTTSTTLPGGSTTSTTVASATPGERGGGKNATPPGG